MRHAVLLAVALFAAPALAQPSPPAGQLQEGAGPVITNPDWVRVPSGEEMARLYPSGGGSGSVRLRCLVAANGFLTRCRVVEEEPADAGFGEASLALVPSFQMRPQTVDGRPVEGASVTIPIRWMLAGEAPRAMSGMRELARSRRGPDRVERRGAGALLLRPAITSAPAAADVIAAAAGREGTATIRCGVTAAGALERCLSLREDPTDAGLGDAAIGLASRFRIDLTDAPERPRGGFDVDVPVAFTRERPEYVARPPWADLPEGPEIEAALRPIAEAQPNRTATATLDCRIGDNGVLADCRTYQATPEPAGPALLTLSSRFRVRPWSEDGYPTAGARVRVPLRYAAD